MPHQCTNCGKIFADGSKEMLSGCPQCGGNKFQFRPRGAVDSTGDASASSGTNRGSAEPSPPGDDTDPGSDDSTTVSEWVKQRADDVMGTSGTGESAASETSVAEGGSRSATAEATGEYDSGTETVHDTSAENNAQASARSDVVSPDELARAADQDDEAADDGPPENVDGTVIEPETDDRPGLNELREELNDQFESIKIINPGQYELNLMELYDRQEYVISLQEDGRYVIEVPDAWRASSPDDE